MRVEFDWLFAGRVVLDPVTGELVIPEDLRSPGIYRLRSGRRDSGTQYDCWYVGRTMVNVEGRVTFHLSQDYDADARHLKRFKSNLVAEDGWVEIDRAMEIRVNGESALRMTPPVHHKDDPDEWEAVEIVFNLVEAVGLVETLPYLGRASKK